MKWEVWFLICLKMWHGFFKTQNPSHISKNAKMEFCGRFIGLFWLLFVGRLVLCLSGKDIFPVSEADFFSRWIFRRATLDQRPTYRRQFMMSVAGRSTFIRLEFPWMSTDRHRLKIENRPRSTGLSGELDKSTDGQPTINGLGKTTIVYRSINGGQSDDVMLQTVSSIN